MNWITENKAYLIAAALFVIAGAKALGWLTVDQAAVLVALLGGLGVVVVHSAVKSARREFREGVAEIKEEVQASMMQSHEKDKVEPR